MVALSKDHRWLCLSVTPLKRPQGRRPCHAYRMMERRRAEEALLGGMTEIERARMRLNTVYATIPIGLIYSRPI